MSDIEALYGIRDDVLSETPRSGSGTDRRTWAIARLAGLLISAVATVGIGAVTISLSESGGVELAVASLTMVAVGGAATAAVANIAMISGATRAAPVAKFGAGLSLVAVVLFFVLGVVLMVGGVDPEWFLCWLSAIVAISAAINGWVTGRDK